MEEKCMEWTHSGVIGANNRNSPCNGDPLSEAQKSPTFLCFWKTCTQTLLCLARDSDRNLAPPARWQEHERLGRAWMLCESMQSYPRIYNINQYMFMELHSLQLSSEDVPTKLAKIIHTIRHDTSGSNAGMQRFPVMHPAVVATSSLLHARPPKRWGTWTGCTCRKHFYILPP